MGLFGVNEVLSVSSYLESQFFKNVNISVVVLLPEEPQLPCLLVFVYSPVGAFQIRCQS